MARHMTRHFYRVYSKFRFLLKITAKNLII